MFLNYAYVADRLSAFPKWAGIAIGAAIVLALVFLAFFPMFQGKRFARLEKRTCMGDGAAFSLGPSAPYWISMAAAFVLSFRAYNGGFHASTDHISWLRRELHPNEFTGFCSGMDFSSLVDYALPFGFTARIPSELAMCLDFFAAYWYIPVVASALSVLLRIRCFKSVSCGLRHLLVVLAATHAVYWVYGTYLTFIVMPLALPILFVFGGLFFGGAAIAGRGRAESYEEARKREEEEREWEQDHKVIKDGSWSGVRITRSGVHWWGDDGHRYSENFDGTFSRDD